MSTDTTASPAVAEQVATGSSPAPADAAVHKPADDGSGASGVSEGTSSGRRESLTSELLGDSSATTSASLPGSDPAVVMEEGDASPLDQVRESADEQLDEVPQPEDPPEPDDDPRLAAPVRGRIRNLRKERDQLATAFATLDRHLEGIPPEEVNDHLALVGRAARGDASAKVELAQRLGLSAPPSVPSAALSAEDEQAVTALEDVGYVEEAQRLRARLSPRVQSAPPAAHAGTDAVFHRSVGEMRAVVAELQSLGAQAPTVIQAVGRRYQAKMEQLTALAGVEPHPSTYGRVFREAKEEVLSGLRPRALATGDRPAAGGGGRAAPSLTDELIAGR